VAKVIRFHEFGGADVLRVEQVAVPEPGAGEVRIAVQAIGVNRADALWRMNSYIEDATLPSGLGNEAVGIVERAGPGVVDFAPGERVAVLPGAGQARYPTYGDTILAPVTHLVRPPPEMSASEAAAAYMAYLTGYFPLFEMARLARGDALVVTGASSGTGIAALQMARVAGLDAIALTRTASKRQALLDAGATHVVDTETQDVASCILDLTGGRGVPLVYDGVGGSLVERLGDVVARHGWYVLYGLSGGVEFTYPVAAQFRRSWRFHVYKVLEFTGAPSLGLPRDQPAMLRALDFLHRHFASGQLRVLLDRAFSLDDAAQAHRYVEQGMHIGKVVLKV